MCSIKSLQTGSGRMVLTIFPSVWPPIHQCQDQHGVKIPNPNPASLPTVQREDPVSQPPSQLSNVKIQYRSLPPNCPTWRSSIAASLPTVQHEDPISQPPSQLSNMKIQRWYNHHFSAIFAKKVVETGILWQFYGLIYWPVQGHSLFNLLPKTKLSSKEQQNRLWCIQLALKPDVQHKVTSNRLRPYCIDYFSSQWQIATAEGLPCHPFCDLSGGHELWLLNALDVSSPHPPAAL